MSTRNHRWSLIVNLGIVAAAVLLCAPVVRAQPPAESARHNAAKPLMTRDLIGMAGKEVVVSEVDVPPGAGSKPHRHDAQVFVYVLQGTMIMQVKGGPRMTLGPGQMFYENPSDIHIVSSNASKTETAKFLAFVIKDKGKPVSRPVPADEAQ
jgi:quercetin dioxygenase-like cupin family protein